jgi:hypothetical protein
MQEMYAMSWGELLHWIRVASQLAEEEAAAR